MIQHAAVFKLKHAKGSAEKKGFLAALGELRNFFASNGLKWCREQSVTRITSPWICRLSQMPSYTRFQ